MSKPVIVIANLDHTTTEADLLKQITEHAP